MGNGTELVEDLVIGLSGRPFQKQQVLELGAYLTPRAKGNKLGHWWVLSEQDGVGGKGRGGEGRGGGRLRY